MKKSIVCVLILIFLSHNAFAQTIITTSSNIIYFDTRDTTTSRRLLSIAKICNCFLEQNHLEKNQSFVLLDIEKSTDTIFYQLGFDNIYGTSVTNNIYNPKGKYENLLGIRIKCCDSIISVENIIKLLLYGVTHIEKLKELRLKSVSLDAYSRPHNITLNKKTIGRILKKPLPLNERRVFKNCDSLNL